MICKTWHVCKCEHQVCIRCAYVMHGKSWLSTFRPKCVKHTPNDQNMYNHGNPQNLVLIRVQNNTKMPFEHFVKHLVCTYKTNTWTMHEHEWKLSKYVLICHKGPTQTQTDQMGQSPIKKLKIFQQFKVPNPFSKIP